MLSDKMLNLILEENDLKENKCFGIMRYNYKFRVNKNGLELKNSNKWINTPMLNDLILGKLEIYNYPYVPEDHNPFGWDMDYSE